MSKPDVLQLVQDLSAGLADPVTSERFYRDVVVELGQREVLVNLALLQHGTNLATFEAPPSTLQILGVFYNDTMLSPMPQRQMEALHRAWRDRTGEPVAVIMETEGDKRFRLWPEPTAPSSTFSFPHGAPLGEDYPANGIGVLYTETRDDLPVWLELPVALLVLAREMNRESSHRDPAFAVACQQVGELVLSFSV